MQKIHKGLYYGGGWAVTGFAPYKSSSSKRDRNAATRTSWAIVLGAMAIMMATAPVSSAVSEEECEAVWVQSDANENGILEGEELTTFKGEEEATYEDHPPITKPQFLAECFQEPPPQED